MNTVIDSLGQIVQASFVTQKQKNHIASLLQARADSEEDAEMGSGVMNVDAIMETLGEMEDKAEDSLTEARKGETEGQNSYALMKAGLENEIKNSKQEMSESTQKSASTSQELATAEKD